MILQPWCASKSRLASASVSAGLEELRSGGTHKGPEQDCCTPRMTSPHESAPIRRRSAHQCGLCARQVGPIDLQAFNQDNKGPT